MKEVEKITKNKNKKTFLIISYFIIISLVFSISATFAWFSSVLVNIDGNLGLGNLSATARLYENYDDTINLDSYLDGLTDAKVIDSNGTHLPAFDMIEKSWYSNVYTSIYIEDRKSVV